MKRDMELIRKILFYIEENYEAGKDRLNIIIENYTTDIIYEHCKLAEQENFLQVFEKSSGINRFYSVSNLTKQGYDYLDIIRDDGTWSKTLKTITEKGLNMSINTIGTIATAFISSVTEGVVNSFIKNNEINKHDCKN